MKESSRQKLYVNAYIAAAAIGVVLLAGSFSILNIYIENLEKNDRLEVYERHFFFINELKSLITNNTNLLKGYRTYIRQNPDINYEDSAEFLDLLLEDDLGLIRNIGVVKDTTIIWNYPHGGNEKAIGVDLSGIEGQREDVLRVKNTLKPIFAGPVDLVQGGKGFIVRIPLVIQSEYWGQISVVLDAGEYFSVITDMAGDYEFSFVFYRTLENGERSIITGDAEILDQSPVLTKVEILNSSLEVGIIPIDGWPGYTGRFILLQSIAGFFSLVLAFLVFMLVSTRSDMREMAIHDSLTGLHNRTFFNNYLKILKAKADRTKTKAGFLVVDINKFKVFNDTYGHKIGDKVLSSLGERFEHTLRHSETAFRVGGDEFVICLPDVKDAAEVRKVVQRLNKELNFTVTQGNLLIPVSVSIGFAVYPDDGVHIDTVLEKADQTMYREKGSR